MIDTSVLAKSNMGRREYENLKVVTGKTVFQRDFENLGGEEKPCYLFQYHIGVNIHAR
jgi:hypothetical protein